MTLPNSPKFPDAATHWPAGQPDSVQTSSLQDLIRIHQSTHYPSSCQKWSISCAIGMLWSILRNGWVKTNLQQLIMHHVHIMPFHSLTPHGFLGWQEVTLMSILMAVTLSKVQTCRVVHCVALRIAMAWVNSENRPQTLSQLYQHQIVHSWIQGLCHLTQHLWRSLSTPGVTRMVLSLPPGTPGLLSVMPTVTVLAWCSPVVLARLTLLTLPMCCHIKKALPSSYLYPIPNLTWA